MSRYQPGDIVEIRLEQGLAYAQLTHEHESYPPVVRLFRGLSDSRPSDLEAHVAQAPRLTAMIPLEQALDRLGLAKLTGGRAKRGGRRLQRLWRPRAMSRPAPGDSARWVRE